jgi:N-acetylglutamate synthase-like GNAT family acetyltransferase
LNFRRFVAADLPQCMELYALNEPGRFPIGVSESYKKSLTEQASYYLVAEREGQIIASGGLSYWKRQDFAILCFGLVRPSHQGKGIGTALVLARLALLNPKRPEYHVLIFAVEKSVQFYQRFGFRGFLPWQDLHGDQHPSGHLLVTRSEIRKCRALLQEHGVVIPNDEELIPFRAGEAENPAANITS